MTDPREPRSFKPSGKNAPGFRSSAAREFTAGAYERGATAYHDVRPGYPSEIAELIANAGTVLDIGAGTGKLTESLLAPGRRVVAADPSPDMARVLRARLPGVPVVRATAEALPLTDASFNAITLAQTWHWVDVEPASAEAARVVTPQGRLLLVWNTLDVTHPWVLRYSRISHSGDVHREGFYPEVATPWRLERELRTRWIEPVTTDDLFALAKTRSYWLRANESTRQTVEKNLTWYLFDRLGFEPGQVIPLPYRTDAFVYELSPKNPRI